MSIKNKELRLPVLPVLPYILIIALLTGAVFERRRYFFHDVISRCVAANSIILALWKDLIKRLIE